MTVDHVVGVQVLDRLGCLDELQMSFKFRVTIGKKSRN